MEVYEITQRDTSYTGNLPQNVLGRVLVSANNSEELLQIVEQLFGVDFDLDGLYGYEMPIHLFDEDITLPEIWEVMADYYQPYDLSDEQIHRYGASQYMMLHVN